MNYLCFHLPVIWISLAECQIFISSYRVINIIKYIAVICFHVAYVSFPSYWKLNWYFILNTSTLLSITPVRVNYYFTFDIKRRRIPEQLNWQYLCDLCMNTIILYRCIRVLSEMKICDPVGRHLLNCIGAL